jgi:integrase
VELLKDLKEEAFAQRRAKATDYVFTTEDGNPLHYRNVGKAFDAAAKRAKLNERGRKLRFHDLRRTFASLLINAGRPAPYFAKQLGHSVQVLYSIYTGLLEAQEGQNREQHLEAIQAFRIGS